LRKPNPRKVQRTQADVDKAWEAGERFGTWGALVMLFTVLYDKEHAGPEDIRRVWDEVNYLAESVAERRVSLNDLDGVLREEYGVEVRK